MNMHRNPQDTVTMTKSEAAAVEKFAESSVNLQRDMQKLYTQFSTLSTQFSTILSRLEKLEGKQPPPPKQPPPKPDAQFQKAWEDYDY